ncbi:hypothetical protein [Streptomyces sp. NPDC001546]|uniref:hypothetical protein n=1 Tax=Streptomyces sp. NPDC001546 TaxID=3364585 RepID=UPI0036C412F6
MGTTFVRRGVLAASAVSSCLSAAACDSGSGTGAGTGRDGSVEDARADAAPGDTAKPRTTVTLDACADQGAQAAFAAVKAVVAARAGKLG